MGTKITLQDGGLEELRRIDERLVSYNIEMTEVTGGTFWKAYTPEQIAGTEPFPPIKDFAELATLMQVYPPIDLYEKNIRTLAAALGSCYIRVSGSWATGTYYDFDGHTGGEIPEGYRAVLTKEQWTGVLDFVKAVNGKLLISVSNCDGDHVGGKPWTPEQAKLLFDFSRDYGVPIDAAEFMNEPNMLGMSGAPNGYTLEDFTRDQDAFYRFVRENYPEVLIVGPCACGDAISERTAAMAAAIKAVKTVDMLELCKEKADAFSYHCYAGVSERGASIGGHWDAEDAMKEEYLGVVRDAAEFYAPIRDKYCPGGQMWVTEAADAGCGGNTWGSTFLDVIRSADELGRFATITDGIIFHNTLASSDYGYLDHRTHLPRPNYWLVYLWNKLVGMTVYRAKEEIREGAHVYVHSRRDGKTGYVYILINNSKTDVTEVELPCDAEAYVLSGSELRSPDIMLNGTQLKVGDDLSIPETNPVKAPKGSFCLPPATVAYLVL